MHLIRLLENCEGIDKIIERRSRSNVNFDTHIHLLSLPGMFSTEMDSIPSSIPYIGVNPVAAERWRIKLENSRDFKIGIVWAGSPTFRDYYRSCSLNDFAILAEIPGITFYSLQKGPAANEISHPPEGMKIINLDKELTDFNETAAVMYNLDLIISTDTAVVHLAGAIGKPVWTLLHTSSDWRWFLNRDDCPWYPAPSADDLAELAGMRLFRQSGFNDWKGVFERVREALLQEIKDCRVQDIPESEAINTESNRLLQEALKFHQAGDFYSAIIFYKEFINQKPDDAMAHCNLGSALQASGSFEDALICYRNSIALRPDYIDAHYNLGNTLRQLGMINEAVASYRQAVFLKPDNGVLPIN